jgi:UDP-N-acetylmuramoyl-L-alanyl-D-glutamate--2,6-diaminopimelate ligase
LSGGEKLKLYDLCGTECNNIENVPVTGITDNTKNLERDNIFVCITGRNFDGHSAAKEMLDKGAAAVVTQRDLGLSKQIIVPDTRKYYSFLASNFCGNPSERLKLIGVTGTNGKSTVLAMIKHILECFGKKCGSIGTVGYDVCGKIYEARLTTPYPMDLYGYLREMADNKAEYCVIEASSQALSQSRFSNEHFETAVFTNLTRDHLDWHGTMEKYFKAKRELFDMCNKAVIFADDIYGNKLIKYTGKKMVNTVTYSVKTAANYFAINVKQESGTLKYFISSTNAEKSFPVTLKMQGEFNAANSLAAVAVCTELGFPLEETVLALSSFNGVRGRSEVIYKGKFTVICDYAHTEDGLVKILQAVKSAQKCAGKSICVFGAAGERDESKRPAMGKAVAENCDFAVITSDNPRFENETDIIEQVAAGIKGKFPYLKIADRKTAVITALETAKEGDTVILCGKGHETYQVIGDDYRHFDEREIVSEFVGG